MIRRCIFVFVVGCFVLGIPLVANWQIVSAQPEKAPLVRCWVRAASILSEAGIFADSSNAYFVVGESDLHAVDIRTGEIVWSTEIGGKILTSILATDRSLIVVSTGPETVPGNPGASIVRSMSSKTGIANWKRELPVAAHYFVGETRSGIAVVSSRSEILMLHEPDGTIVWSSSYNGRLVAVPEIGVEQVTIATAQKKVETFSATDGKRTGSFELKFVPVAVSLVGGSEAIYSDERGGVYSTNIDDSQRNWKFKAGGKVTALQTVGGKILLASVDNFVYLMSPDTGNIFWKRRMPGRIANMGMVSPKSVAVTIIGERSAFVIDADNGKFTDLITLNGDDAFLLTPIRANGTYLLTATVNGLSGFSTSCGQEKSGK